MSCHVTSFKMFFRQTPEHIQGDEGIAGSYILRSTLSHIIYFCHGIKEDDLFICLSVSSTLSDSAVH